MDHTEKVSYLENLKSETISPTQLAKVLGGRPFAYNQAAKNGNLALPHFFRGSNLRIFRQPVLDLIRGNTRTVPQNTTT